MQDNTVKNLTSNPLLDPKGNDSGSLLFVLSIVAYLATIALMFSLSMNRISASWNTSLKNTATVQILVDNPRLRETQVGITLKSFKENYPNSEVTVVGKKKSLDMLKPWLGDSVLPDDLPIPALISVKFAKEDNKDLAYLTSDLKAEGVIIEIDDHTRWSEQVKRSAPALKVGSSALLILIFSVAMFITNYATKSALLAQKKIINILLQVGAKNIFITKLFIKQACIRGLVSGFYGVSLGCVTMILISTERVKEILIIAPPSFHWPDLVYLLTFIIGFSINCSISAGLTSTNILSKKYRRK
jgi:cell division transport system permease protein